MESSTEKEKREFWLRLLVSRKKFKKAFFGFFYLSLFLLVAVFFAGAWSIYQYSKEPFMPRKADYAIVLGARAYGNKPTRVFSERIQFGIRLYQEGYVKKIIFTGKPGNPPQALVGKKIAIEQGVPETDIVTETKSKITFENLKHALATLPESTSSSFLIVSDPIHLKRALLMARDLKMDAYPAPTPDGAHWSSWNQFKFLLRETLAYLKYRVKRLI